MKSGGNKRLPRNRNSEGVEQTIRQEGYAAFTYSVKDKNKLIDYVKNQEAQHWKICFKEELTELLEENFIEFDENIYYEHTTPPGLRGYY